MFHEKQVLAAAGLSFIGLTMFVAPAQAQTAPDAGRLLQEERGRVLPSPPPSAQPPVMTQPGAKATLAPESGMVVKVRAFKLLGVTAVKEAKLLAIAAPSLGKEMGLRELQAIAEQMAEYYRQQGYFLAQVILPPQDVTEGVITLRAIEGRLKEGDQGVKVVGNKRVSRDLVRGMLRAPIAANGALKQEDLERGVLLLNDVPGVNAGVTVEPGVSAESTALRAQLKDRPVVRGSLTLDNIGNRYTGIFRAGGNIFLDNPSGLGDQFAVSGNKGLDGEFNYGRVNYSLPLNNNGLRMSAGLSHVDYRSGKELAAQNVTGKADAYTVGLTYPVLRSKTSNLSLALNYETRRMAGDTLGITTSDRTANVGGLNIFFDRIDQLAGGGVISGNLGVSGGSIDLSRLPSALVTDQFSAQTNGKFYKYTYGLNRLQTVNDSTVLQLSANGQAGRHRNLDTSEKFSIGGPSAVRAYPSGQGLGDAGTVASLELRTVVSRNTRLGNVPLGELQLAAFYDYGHVTQYRNLWAGALSGPNSYSLKGAGLGVNLGRSGIYDLRVFYARQLGENPGLSLTGKLSDGTSDRDRVAMLLNVYF